ncbi:MAG TPA: MFS transporter, partial [Candidatus Lachnoclostridium stercoripullorum]|nr:MFS transporter [Candidatus Lachnoclostridium stercoripullorum]
MSRSGSPSAVRALGDRPASRTLEKGAVLSLSLLLTSTYSVSTVIPSMVSYYQGYGRGQIEQLISVTSVAIMVVILLNPWISRIISQRVSIVSGLLLLSAGGCLPVFTKEYGAVFAGRLVLGVGIGLVNVYAVDMINSRFEGEERSTLLGYRGSAEIVGNTALTLVVGQILGAGLDWRYCFLIYLSGLLVLISYLLFVPKAPGKTGNPADGVLTGKSGPAAQTAERAQKAPDWRRHAWGFLSCALHGAMFIGINTCTTMRIPSLVLERGMGTEA